MREGEGCVRVRAGPLVPRGPPDCVKWRGVNRLARPPALRKLAAPWRTGCLCGGELVPIRPAGRGGGGASALEGGGVVSPLELERVVGWVRRWGWFC